MSPINLSRNRATEFAARGIPDRGHVSDPEAKRVLDALAENVGRLNKRIDQVYKAFDREENAVAAKQATSGSGIEDKPDGDDSSTTPVLQAENSVVIEGNKIKFKNDEDPGAKYIYASNAAGVRGWMNMTTFVNEILKDALDTYMNAWITNYIENSSVNQYVCTGVQYDEPTKTFSQVFVELQILAVVQGSQIVGNVYVAEECPE